MCFRVLQGKVFGTQPHNAPLSFALTRTVHNTFYGPNPGPTRLYSAQTEDQVSDYTMYNQQGYEYAPKWGYNIIQHAN